MKNMFNYSGAKMLAALIFALIAAGCDNSAGGGAASARDTAIANITRVLGKTLDAASHSDATTQVSKATAGAAQADKTGNLAQGSTAVSTQSATFSAGMAAKPANPLAKAALQVMQMRNAPTSATVTLDEQVAEMLDLLLQNPTTNSDGTVVYHPNTAKFCAGNVDVAACEAQLDHVTVLFQSQGPDAGILTIRYDSFTPTVVGYAPNMVYVENDINQSILVFNALVPNSGMNATGSGKSRLTLRVTGEQAVEVTFGVTEAIAFEAATTSKSGRLSIAKAEKALRIAMDGATKSVTVQFGMGEFSESSTTTADATTGAPLQAPQTTSAHLDKLNASIVMTSSESSYSVHVTGVDMGNSGFVVKTNNVVDSSIKISADDFGMEENATQWTMTFTQSLALEMSSSRQTITISALENTVLTKTSTSPITQVTSGQFSYAASDSASTPARNEAVTVSAGQCFAPVTSGEAVLVPVRIEACA